MVKVWFDIDNDRALVSLNGDFVRYYTRYGNENVESFKRNVLKENTKSLR